MEQTDILKTVLGKGIRPMDIVRMSKDRISLNQASQWLNADRKNRNLSVPVLMMLELMCDVYSNVTTVALQKKENKSQNAKMGPAVLKNDTVVEVIADLAQVKKIPVDAFVKSRGIVRFRYLNVGYSFAYSGEKEIAFVHNGDQVTVSGDFEKVIGPMEFDVAF